MLWEEFSRRATAQTRARHEKQDADVRYYAEKHLSTWQVDLSELPPFELIAVLRDPRDTYVSIASFAKKREKAGRKRSMGQQPGESHDAWLKRHLARQRDRLRWLRKAMDSGKMPVVRYENLVLSLDEEARRLEEILGVELDPAAVAADEKMRATHVSASTPEASVGRWRREMDPELVKRFNDELGKELEALGFDTSRARAGRDPHREPGHERMSEERELIDALAAANEDRAQLRAAVVDLRGQLEGARREQDETERWLRSLERSRSWRITRPLRDAGHLALARAPAADAVRPPRLTSEALPCAPVPGTEDAQDVLRAAEQEHELAREVLTDGGRRDRGRIRDGATFRLAPMTSSTRWSPSSSGSSARRGPEARGCCACSRGIRTSRP